MLNNEKINDLSNKIREILNNSPVLDLQNNINALLKGAFTKMELISREEYDVQAEVLRNTKKKLELIEAKLAALEADLTSRPTHKI
ncbi:MAG: accessory factor UbiK family protein [Methylotenera sp.]|nr:accessory factor UbiK family protein [Methylotenera sp.]